MSSDFLEHLDQIFDTVDDAYLKEVLLTSPKSTRVAIKDNNALFEFFNRDMIVHKLDEELFHDFEDESDWNVPAFDGVYVPIEGMIMNGRPVYQFDNTKTRIIVNALSNMTSSARNVLDKRLISFDSPSEGKFVGDGTLFLSYGTSVFSKFFPGFIISVGANFKTSKPFVCWLRNDSTFAYILNDPDFLWVHSHFVFSKCLFNYDGKKIKISASIVPATTFRRSVEMARLSSYGQSCQPHPKAMDFWLWDRSIVLHSNRAPPSNFSKSCMGVYKPLRNKYCQGYPVWILDKDLTRNLSRRISEDDAVKRDLLKRGLQLQLPSEHFSKNPPCMYMKNEKLCVTDSKNPRQSYLQNNDKPLHELRLMTEPDALLSLNKQAFASWELFQDDLSSSRSIEVRVATTPLKYFEHIIKVIKLEMSLIDDSSTSKSSRQKQHEFVWSTGTAGKAPNKKRKKKNKKKRTKTKKNVESEAEDKVEPVAEQKTTMDKNLSFEISNVDDTFEAKVGVETKSSKEEASEVERIEQAGRDTKTKKKQKKQKKKKPSSQNKKGAPKSIVEVETNARICNTGNTELTGKAIIDPKLEHKKKYFKDEKDKETKNVITVVNKCRWLLKKICPDSIDSESFDSEVRHIDNLGNVTVGSVVCGVFDPSSESPPWLSVDESITSPLLFTLLQQEIVPDAINAETLKWIQLQAEKIFSASYQCKRSKDIMELLRAQIPITPEVLKAIFKEMPKGRGHELNNKLASSIKSIRLSTKSDFRSILDAASMKISKKARKYLVASLKEAQIQMENERKSKKETKSSISELEGRVINENTKTPSLDKTCQSIKHNKIEVLYSRIESKLNWYSDVLKKESTKAFVGHDTSAREQSDHEEDSQPVEDKIRSPEPMKESHGNEAISKIVHKLSSEEVATRLDKCADLPPTQQMNIINNVEMSMDLFENGEAPWTIDITEQAHKWFRKRSKRNYQLCERVIRRLKLLSSGRWPSVLCKPLKMKKVRTQLYETKIDAARRIIWEVAVSFSPRRSVEDKNYCEQVIRVWDIVEDHDNLQRAIQVAASRIEKSHCRGEQCMIYSELSDSDTTSISESSTETRGTKMFVPRVFSIHQSDHCYDKSKPATSTQSKPSIKHFPPANDDDQQFNLLKFYELNAGAIKLILNSKDENSDLPFTPGPKEHEIIHFRSQPPRSLLLMGRSGTGKTTCLVFRMWAQYMAYCDNGQEVQPRQLFVTKNAVLRTEVEKSFKSMGLAWRRSGSKPLAQPSSQINEPSLEGKPLPPDVTSDFPKFLSSAEWLDALDHELPGESFFTPNEAERRVYRRKEDDTVERGMEDFFAKHTASSAEATEGSARQEMTFATFFSSWRKINSRIRADVDPSLVWLEIKSFIKGSITALHMGARDRSEPTKRFLSREQYLELPRKQSRLDGQRRKEVYDLFLSYERLKKDRNYYDEMDLVYNLAGRIHLLTSTYICKLLPIDTVFVDEVQDFTQAELYLLTKLCRDPNNLMLAGDTAQSIAVGVGFRFTDVRQIFYNNFGGKEPKLLQLTHNYRSHSGVLRLAASVVELLYFFFSDSLDKLPPDLGLFPGPKPIIMEVKAVADLVLMLDGSKRETSRIEFGAHQVVIVRNEKAKQLLPDEFSVDRDWVMTVQEAKGLEFDDVLLYNFFTDSEAGELWRVVSNYERKDIEAYFSEPAASLTGIQRYDWDELETQIRPLGFNKDRHKILETEFKMLYTAITRARINVFIAEEDSTLSRPMFHYFKSRRLVDVVGDTARDGSSELRAFGGKLDTPEEWRARGEYYLQNAEGQRQVGCLRLAANCFEKSGDRKKRDQARAYLAFVEIQDLGASPRRRAKQSTEYRERLLGITAQLLEAEEFGLLNKASWCLLQTGDQEFLRCANMFEIYALMCYYQRMKRQSNDISPSSHEQQYFSYAAKLFMKCSSQQDISPCEKTDIILCAFKNFLRSATASDLKEASILIETNLEHCQSIFTRIYCLYKGNNLSSLDPLLHFSGEAVKKDAVRQSIIKLARIACRLYHAAKDKDGFSTAIEAIPTRSERIKVLSSLECDAEEFISDTQWASHPCFQGSSEDKVKKKKKNTGSKDISIDVADLLIRNLDVHKDNIKVSDVLEERGRLLEAAKWLEDTSTSKPEKVNRNYHMKALELKARYIELLLDCPGWREKSAVQQIMPLLLKSVENSDIVIPTDVKLSILLSDVKINGTEKIWKVLECCVDSFIWRHEGLLTAMRSPDLSTQFLTEKDTWHQLNMFIVTAHEAKHAAEVLTRPLFRSVSNEDMGLISQIESYFQLTPYRIDPNQLLTKVVTNMRLRKAIQSEGDILPVAATSLQSKALSVAVDREKIRSILGRYLCRSSVALLETLEKYLIDQMKQSQPCLYLRSGGKCTCGPTHGSSRQSLNKYFDLLQLRILCLHAIRELCVTIEFICLPKQKSFWMNKKEEANQRAKLCTTELVSHLSSSHIRFVKIPDEKNSERPDYLSIALRLSVLDVLEEHAHTRWYDLEAFSKKSDLFETIQYWRILRLCCGNDDASVKVQDKLAKVEQNIWRLQEDWSKNKRDHFIKTKIKVKDGKVVAAEIAPRMWLWAVNSVTDDLFNSIRVIHRVIKETKIRPGLKALPKHEQVVLLEANAVGLFAALSLRYSEPSNKARFWCVIPERSYLNSLLLGEGTQGLGVALKDTLEKTCHKYFFETFEQFVRHLETISDLIVSNHLLSVQSKMSPLEYERFERAVVLTVFIIANATSVFRIGSDMSPRDARDEVEIFPKLPLCGAIGSLLKCLRKLIEQYDEPSLLLDQLRSTNDLSSVQDLLEATNDTLQVSRYDKFLLCRLRQNGQSVRVETRKEYAEFTKSRLDVPFNEAGDVFKQQGWKCESFLTKKGEEASTAIEHEIQDAELSKKSDQMNAAISIQRFVRSQKRNSVSDNSSRKNSFKRWKQIMKSFTRMAMKKFNSEKNRQTVENISDRHVLNGQPRVTDTNRLSSIKNMWNDQHLISSMKSKWVQYLFMSSPICDFIECGYCVQIFDPAGWNERNFLWQQNYFNLSYTQAARQCLPSPIGNIEIYNQHCLQYTHRGAFNGYGMHADELSSILGSLEVSRLMLLTCSRFSDKGSWYINLVDKANYLLNEIDDLQIRLLKDATVWPLPPGIRALMENANILLQISKSFYLQKLDEEPIHDGDEEEEDSARDDDDGDESIADDFVIE